LKEKKVQNIIPEDNKVTWQTKRDSLEIFFYHFTSNETITHA